MESGRELIARVAGALGERGVAVRLQPGTGNPAELDVLHDPPQRGLEGASQSGYTAMLIVPTGTGAKIGGFAGDALPVARAMSAVGPERPLSGRAQLVSRLLR